MFITTLNSLCLQCHDLAWARLLRLFRTVQGNVRSRGTRAGRLVQEKRMRHSDNIQTLVSHPSSRSRFAYSRKTSSCSNYNNLTIIPCKPTERGNTLTIRPVHFGLLNARSVNKKTLIVKDFQVVVEHCIDLQAVTETWLQSEIDASMAIPVGKCVIFVCFYIYLFIYFLPCRLKSCLSLPC